MKIESVNLTPKLAKELLEMNTHNRPVREGYVELLANEILEKRWRDYTGDTIRISKDRVLLDGQHRMLAVILANQPIKTHIVYGVDGNAMDVIDTGMRRQPSDVLHLNGVKYAPIVSAVIKYVAANGNGAGMSNTNSFCSNREIRDVYNQDPVFWDNVSSSAYKWYVDFRAISPKMFGGCFALALKESRHATKVAEFFNLLSSGKTGEEVILKLRKLLINNQMAARKYGPAVKRDLIKAHFNGYIKNQKTPYNNPDGKWL